MSAGMPPTAADEIPTALAVAQAMYARDIPARALGMEIQAVERGSATLTMEVRPDMLNGHGICHGGFIFTLADTAFAYACNSYNRTAVAFAAQIHYLQPGRLGDRLTATAVARLQGRRAGVYDVEVTNQDGILLAIFRGESVSKDTPVL